MLSGWDYKQWLNWIALKAKTREKWMKERKKERKKGKGKRAQHRMKSGLAAMLAEKGVDELL